MRKYVFNCNTNKFLCFFKVVTKISLETTLKTLNVLNYIDCCNMHCYLMRKSGLKTNNFRMPIPVFH